MTASKKVTVSCPTKFHSDYMANQLEKHNLLAKVYTAHPKSRYLNRVFLPINKIFFMPFIFILPFLTNKLKIFNSLTSWLNERLPVLFDRWVSKKIPQTDILIVWAWAGLKTINTVKKQGGIIILEECGSCNKFQNEILTEEYEKLKIPFLKPTSSYIINRELDEASIADYILCPSNYVAQSFIKNGFEKARCKVIPYGVSISLFKPDHKEKKDFKVIFVGSVGVRKGLIYLFKALEILKLKYPISCLIVGKVDFEFVKIFKKYQHLFTHLETVPHHQLVKYYNLSSVFVLPSLDEGMAYVQLEAMACGIPVICTPNSGAEAIIDHNKDGVIIPIRTVNPIVENIERLYLNKDLLTRMSSNAYKKAQSYTWDDYGKKLANFISEL